MNTLEDLSAENLLQEALQRGDRQRYLRRLDAKEGADIKIAENYLLSIIMGRANGVPYNKCLPAKQRHWLMEQINRHSKYFGGIAMIKDAIQ